ncbi:MAG: dockerin type I domain-containing protein [Planctomycetota bacterium]
MACSPRPPIVMAMIFIATCPPTMTAHASDPFADQVVDYAPGTNPVIGYVDPSTALGPPERDSGEGIDPGVVSPFQPAWLPHEIVSIGRGGALTVSFDEPITDDPLNPYGIDLIIFGNALLIDGGDGMCATPCSATSEGGLIEVSPDGINWFPVENAEADGFAPTLGYRDAAAYQVLPGTVPTDPTLPIDPALTPSHFDNATIATIDAFYYGSAGGVGVDLQSIGLASVIQVRISNPMDSQFTPEIDAIADVAPQIEGDVNFNGVVNIDDLLLVINDFGVSPPGGPASDVTRNGVVNIDDVLTVINNWSSS